MMHLLCLSLATFMRCTPDMAPRGGGEQGAASRPASWRPALALPPPPGLRAGALRSLPPPGAQPGEALAAPRRVQWCARRCCFFARTPERLGLAGGAAAGALPTDPLRAAGITHGGGGLFKRRTAAARREGGGQMGDLTALLTRTGCGEPGLHRPLWAALHQQRL